jgi:hypothetical protein
MSDNISHEKTTAKHPHIQCQNTHTSSVKMDYYNQLLTNNTA